MDAVNQHQPVQKLPILAPHFLALTECAHQYGFVTGQTKSRLLSHLNVRRIVGRAFFASGFMQKTFYRYEALIHKCTPTCANEQTHYRPAINIAAVLDMARQSPARWAISSQMVQPNGEMVQPNG